MTDNQEPAEGWYRDPTGHHAQRWFSAGAPTALVRDGRTTANDPLSDAEAKAAASATLEFISLPGSQPADRDDDRPPPGQVAWWDTGVRNKDEPEVDWGLDGAAGYEITMEMRLANRIAQRRRDRKAEKQDEKDKKKEQKKGEN